MLACAIDFESTGLDVQKERITEYGAILFEEKEGSVSEISRAGALIYEPDYAPLSKEVIEVTGITDEMLKLKGVPFLRLVYGLVSMFQTTQWPQVFVAHNKGFDEQIFKWEMKRHKEELLTHFGVGELDKIFDIPWLCTIEDIKHPDKFKCKKLSHLALDYGVIVNPNLLHRAVDDVELLVRMIYEGEISLDAMAEFAQTPWIVVRALVPSPYGKGNDGGAGKEAAKECGFGWKKPWGSQVEYGDVWVKRIKETDMQALQEKLGYELVIVEKI